MRYSLAPLALAALAAANPFPSGVTASIAPSATAPPGCSPDYSGSFEIEVANITSSSKRDVQLAERQSPTDVVLVLNLSNGILHDQAGRTGYIANTTQFQFDDPPQSGAIFTAGFSVCSNGSLALGGQAYFWQCLSGTFYNLYTYPLGGQCNPVNIQVIAGSASGSAATVQSDGQPTASPVASEKTDGQITASPASSPICEYTDGQPQETACAPVTQISDGQPQAPTSTAVSPVAIATEGQPQVTTSSAVSPVAIATEGQPQVTTSSAVSPVAIATEGQPQVTTSSATSPVAIATEGQPQVTTSQAAAFTGAAAPVTLRGEFFGLAAGVVAVALL